jgi:hypothetical protein
MGDWRSRRCATRRALMMDLSDREAIAARLREAQRQFERGGPVPIMARDLLQELAHALADSGPREFDQWLDAVRCAERGLSSANAAASSRNARRVKRSLRQLETPSTVAGPSSPNAATKWTPKRP